MPPQTIQIKLNPTVQAVELVCDVGDRTVRAIVARSVFEDRLGGSSDSATWISSCEAHWAEVREAIRRKAEIDAGSHVIVLLETDFPGADGAAPLEH